MDILGSWRKEWTPGATPKPSLSSPLKSISLAFLLAAMQVPFSGIGMNFHDLSWPFLMNLHAEYLTALPLYPKCSELSIKSAWCCWDWTNEANECKWGIPLQDLPWWVCSFSHSQTNPKPTSKRCYDALLQTTLWTKHVYHRILTCLIQVVAGNLRRACQILASLHSRSGSERESQVLKIKLLHYAE